MTVSDEPAPPLAVSLLGPFCLQVNGVPLPRLRWRKQEALLALLILRHPHPLERSWLAGLLWPECDASQGLATLRRYLTDLRRALGPEAARLHSPSTASLALDLVGASVDLVAFDAALARGDPDSLAEAVGLYQGPLLEEWTEEWVFQERQAREEGYLGALEKLATAALAGGELGRAEGHLRRAVAVDPLRESAQRALMEALGRGGNYAAVLRTYRELRLRLYREVNAEPDAETQALFQRLRAEARNKSAAGNIQAPRTALDSLEREFVPGLPADVPPRSIPEAVPHNLPLQLTSFIGREDQIAEIEHWLAPASLAEGAGVRLVTLTGAGGCGKTRLALQVASLVQEAYPEGVWLVEFASLADPALVPQTVAAALGVRESPGQPLTQTLAEHLRPRQLLLVLDNCEHLVAACAHLADALLRSCPRLQILATSREALAIGGERAYRVPSLSLPDAQRRPGLEQLTQYEAVRLFIERARAAQPAFRMTEANAAVVADVCRRLDGLPLAIELAAARVKVLSVEQFARRMEDLFRLLTGGRRTALPRQQTLRATLDWSYDLLSGPERALLRRLSVFAGGWTLEAAETVCAEESGQEPGIEVLDRLTGLVEKSLVLAEPGACEARDSAEVRYRLLETVRQYAWERLADAGEMTAARIRHRDYFLALAERAEQELEGQGQITWLNRLEAEHDNLRTALRCADEAGDGEIVLRLGAGLWQFWHWSNHWREGIEWLERGLAAGGEDVPGALRARVLLGLAMLYWLADDGRVSVSLEEALRLFQALGELRGIGHSLCWLGRYRARQGDEAQGQALGEAAVAVARQAGDRYLLAHSLRLLGINLQGRGELAQAAALLAESASISRQLGNPQLLAWSLQTWGGIARAQGEWGQAATLLAECEPIFRKLGVNWFLLQVLRQRAELLEEVGDQRTAAALWEECLVISRDLPKGVSVADVLRHLGDAARRGGDDEKAPSLYEESMALARAQGEDRVVAWCLCGLALMAVRQGATERAHSLACDSLAIFRAWEKRLWAREYRQGVTRCLEALAQAAYAQGQLARMARLLGAAEAQREASRWRLPPADQADYAAVPATRTALGEEAFAAAWTEGKRTPLEQTIADALQGADPV